MDPFIAVPPQHYGGIERVIADLANGLHRRGHQVTMWAAPGSSIQGNVVPFGRESEWTRWSNIRNTVHLSSRLWRLRGKFDLIHNFGRLAYLTSVLRWDLPKVQTYMRPVDAENMVLARRLGERRLHYTAVSAAIRDTGAPGGGEWSVIYNCAPVEQFSFRVDADPATAPLVFLGRLERCKGAHTAIAVAKQLGRRLVIAGNVSSLPNERKYFHEEIEPKLDAELVSYIGPVDNAAKNRLLGSAAALLLPIEWEEPFPVVLPEALLCGTPVIAFRRGGVPEGIDHGRTGFLCDTEEEMVAAVQQLSRIDRGVCRAEGVRRFGDDAILAEYERLYYRLLAS
ncbi:MAG: glycosyltransferase [Terriglobales bacterium]|jgi:glycosyltransferase involved in cell wall biosynthesis